MKDTVNARKLLADYEDFGKSCEAEGYTDIGELQEYADELRDALTLAMAAVDAARAYASAVNEELELLADEDSDVRDGDERHEASDAAAAACNAMHAALDALD